MGLYSRKLRNEKRMEERYVDNMDYLRDDRNLPKFALFLTAYFSILLIAEKLVQCA